MIIYGSHNEIKPHRILSPHSFNPPLSIIIPLPHHSSNWMRSLPASSRIAEIQTNNQSSLSNPTISIPPCKLASASLNQYSVCRWVLTSRWIIPSKQATETTKHFLPFFLVVRFPVWNTRIRHSHSHYSTSYSLHIPYTPKSNEKLIVTLTLFSLQTIPLFYSSYSKYFSFHSFPTTIHNIAKTQRKLFVISFSFTRFNAWFSSVALPTGVDSASPSH